jgi:hypothetical protein
MMEDVCQFAPAVPLVYFFVKFTPKVLLRILFLEIGFADNHPYFPTTI